MPEMDGRELALAIQANPNWASIPIILLRSTHFPKDEAKPQQPAIAAYLNKPVKHTNLCNTLLSVVRLMDSAPSPQPARSPSPETTPAQPQRRILAVEDNIVNQRVAVHLLEKLGCQVDIANNGHEAIAAASTTVYDLIFMDCHMPGLDGYQATAAIRAREAEHGVYTAIVAMTANAFRGDREKCLAAGMDDYMSKPVRADSLKSMLEKWVPPVPNS